MLTGLDAEMAGMSTELTTTTEVRDNPIRSRSATERHRDMSAEERASRESYLTKFDVGNKGMVDDLEKTMMRYDVSGSGNFSAAEVKAIVRDLETARAETKSARKITGTLLALLFVFSGVMLAVVMAGVEASKETHTRDKKLVTTKGETVQVAARAAVPPP